METKYILSALRHTLELVPDAKWESRAFFQACLEGAEAIFEQLDNSNIHNRVPLPRSRTPRDKTAVQKVAEPLESRLQPIPPPATTLNPSGKKQYDLDSDQGVYEFKRDLETDPKLRESFVRARKEKRGQADMGNKEALLVYPPLRDAMENKDPMGLRRMGRQAKIPSDDVTDVQPDFGHEAVAGEDDTDKESSYEGLLAKNRMLYPNQK